MISITHGGLYKLRIAFGEIVWQSEIFYLGGRELSAISAKPGV